MLKYLLLFVIGLVFGCAFCLGDWLIVCYVVVYVALLLDVLRVELLVG